MKVHELMALLADADPRADVRLMGTRGELFDLNERMILANIGGQTQTGRPVNEFLITCSDVFDSEKSTMRIGFVSRDYATCGVCDGSGRVDLE